MCRSSEAGSRTNGKEERIWAPLGSCDISRLNFAAEILGCAMHPITRSFLGIIILVAALTRAEEVKYSIAPNFFEANPGGKGLGPCHGGTVIDRAGNIYISTDTERGLVVFSQQGKFLRSMGPTRIHGLELRDEGGTEYIYAARPSDHEVLKLKLNGQQEWAFGFPKEADIYKDAAGWLHFRC